MIVFSATKSRAMRSQFLGCAFKAVCRELWAIHGYGEVSSMIPGYQVEPHSRRCVIDIYSLQDWIGPGKPSTGRSRPGRRPRDTSRRGGKKGLDFLNLVFHIPE